MGKVGTPEHLVGTTCKDMALQWQQHQVAAANGIALVHTFTTHMNNLKHVEHFRRQWKGGNMSMIDYAE